jgi:hypothetical protein
VEGKVQAKNGSAIIGRYDRAFEKHHSISDGQEWLQIDPYTSLGAMHITSWKQSFEIKLLVKLKLNSYSYVFDPTLENSLENFISLKKKQEL